MVFGLSVFNRRRWAPNPSSPGWAARIVRAGGSDGIARGIENTGQTGTRLADGADFLRRAVRDVTVEY
jgi:hypothetical protein